MRTCRTCGKSIDHRRADAKHCDDVCRSRYGQGIRAQPPGPEPTAPAGAAPLQTDPVFSDLAAALSTPAASEPAVADPLPAPRPPREPPMVTRPPEEHLREPDVDPASLDKRLFELELRMSAYDMDQPWQDWFDDAKKLVEEARRLVERARQADSGVRERVERIEKQLATPKSPPDLSGLVDEKLRHVWREIERVDKATASRQSMEKLEGQVAVLVRARSERRPDPRPEEGGHVTREALAHVNERIDGLVDAHNWLQRKVLALIEKLVGENDDE